MHNHSSWLVVNLYSYSLTLLVLFSALEPSVQFTAQYYLCGPHTVHSVHNLLAAVLVQWRRRGGAFLAQAPRQC